MGERLLKLLLIDDDPVFRLGLRIWLEQFSDLQVVAEADTGRTALQTVAELQGIADSDRVALSQVGDRAQKSGQSQSLDLVILDLGLGRAAQGLSVKDSAPSTGLQLCQALKHQYPQLPVLLLSSPQEPVIVAAALQAGVEGYCPKGTAVAELVTAIRQVATGQNYWDPAIAASVTAHAPDATSPVLRAATSVSLVGPFAQLRRNLQASSLTQIETALAEVNAQLKNPALSVLERAILAGRWRELRASRWLVNQLLATPAPTQVTSPPGSISASPQRQRGDRDLPAHRTSNRLKPPGGGSSSTMRTGDESELALTDSASISGALTLQARLFEATASKLDSSLRNLTDTPLELDILREEKKRELLGLILRKLEEILEELRFSQVQPGQIPAKADAIARDLWVAATTDFFGKYYTLRIGARDLELVNILLQDAAIVQIAILNRISLIAELIAYLLFETPLVIDNATYEANSPEAVDRANALLHNLLIQVANGVIQPLLNRFADVEVIKQSFYDRRLISTRDIERFRNSLSWKYRSENYFSEPKAIFESKFWLFVIEGRGIAKIAIYAPRNQELAQLSGLPLIVTIALETRDAIAPRVRSAIAFVGSGIVYLLTEVIGRAIGLVGRGILKGIGGAWQDTKFGKNGERPKQ